MKKSLFLLFALLLWCLVVPCSRGAEAALASFAPISELAYPADNATGVDGTRAFEWSTVPGADCYYIWLGKTLGEKDIWESGELQTTSKTVDNLPVGVKIYARMWTKYHGLWRYSDSSFTLASTNVVEEFTPVSNLTYPADNAAGVDGTKAFEWSTVAGADSYYIWLGKTPGEKDIWESGELLITSKTVDNLPVGEKIYARMWTKYQGLWRYSDSSFTLASTNVVLEFTPVSNLTYPADNTTGVDGTKAFEWSTVAGADSYYIWLGKTPGEKDIWESGELLITSKTVNNLPVGEKIYARMWTKYHGLWRYSDSSFTLASTNVVVEFTPVSNLTYPADHATGADGTKAFEWSTVAGADSYYIWLGKTPGEKDIWESGELLTTSKTVDNLPVGVKIYARMWTKYHGLWRYSDSSFTLASTNVVVEFTPVSYLTYPADHATGADGTKAFEWSAVPGADCYYIWLGKSVGEKDIWESGEFQTTSKTVDNLPVGVKIYARMWTKYQGLWRYSDSSFILVSTNVVLTVSPLSQLSYPPDGSSGFDGSRPIEWTTAQGAEGYFLWLGSSFGSNDLYQSGETLATSVSLTRLPAGRTIFARIWTKTNGSWAPSDSTFTVAQGVWNEPESPLKALFVYPLNGAVAVDATRPLEWNAVHEADTYAIYIGSSRGANDVFDSGELNMNGLSSMKLFIDQLPIGDLLYARLWTRAAGIWRYHDITFSVGQTGVDPAKRFETAQWLVAEVRAMADPSNNVTPETTLAKHLEEVTHNERATCYDYAATLLRLINLMNGGSARMINIGFGNDVHTLLQYYHQDQQRWMLLDPTFNLSMKRTPDGLYATVEDMSNATATMEWGAIEYVYLGPTTASAYYLDYPLLFLNKLDGETAEKSPLPYMDEQPLPLDGDRNKLLILQSNESGEESLSINGVTVTRSFTGPFSLSSAFFAKQVALTETSAGRVKAYLPRWYVFR